MELGLLVDGVTGGALVSALGEELEGALDLRESVGPGAVESHELGTVDEALAAEKHEIGLRAAPVAESVGPLLGTTEVVGTPAGVDHGAIHDAGDDGGDLAGRDGEHGFVEEGHPVGDAPEGDEGAS